MPTITLAQKRHELDQHIARKMLQIARDTSTTPLDLPERHTTPAGGDTTRLRGIPAIGRGVSGHIRGTRP